MQIPTLDISDFPGKPDFVEAFGKGYEAFGFCGVVGHGISNQTIDEAYVAMRAFFALPIQVKQKYTIGPGGARGYTRFGVETAKNSAYPDLKEFWQVGREIPADCARHASLFDNVWPSEVELFQARMYRLFEALESLGRRILGVLALYLQLPADYFDDKIDMGNSILRALHYPPIEARETPSLRAAPHEDINLITLLVGSEESGLEVRSRAGHWIPVQCAPCTIVVNIGDMMQRLTNHVLPSTTHQVVNSVEAYRGESRYSIPFFCHPNPDFEISTLASCIRPDYPNRYPQSISADDYLTERLVEIGLLEGAREPIDHGGEQ